MARFVIEDVAFNLLVLPKLEYRVRRVDDKRVDAMTKKLLTCSVLSSQLTVMRDGNNYVIIDGSHRYSSIKKIRELTINGPMPFEKINCQVYPKMAPREVLKLGFKRNQETKDFIEMTDYQKASVIRRIVNSVDSRKRSMKDVYDVIGVTDVSTYLPHSNQSTCYVNLIV